jgi:tetratricopeptide (TPR) repeat protein
LSPHDIIYQCKYARVLAQNQSFEESEAIFSEALKNHPSNPVLLYRFSEMYEWRGDIKQALLIMRRLVEVHPQAHIYDSRVAYLTNRHRFSTVMGSVGVFARRGLGRPIRALVRRLGDGSTRLRNDRGGRASRASSRWRRL